MNCNNVLYRLSIVKNNQIGHDKVVEAIRAANFTEIQNMHAKYKRLIQEILAMIALQLGDLFKKEYLKLWQELRDAKLLIHEKEIKQKYNEQTIEEQEMQLDKIRNQITFNNSASLQNKLLQNEIDRVFYKYNQLQRDNKKFRDLNENITGQNQQLNKQNEKLEAELAQLRLDFQNMKNALEQKIFELQQQNSKLLQNSNGLEEEIKSLQNQLDKYKKLYEKELLLNDSLNDQLKYWKSTHQQRLVDLQQTETRVDSQKGYLFKYRREVEDLKRFKIIGQEAQEQAIQAKQQLYHISAKSEQIKQSYQSFLTQTRLSQQNRTENLNDILLQYAHPQSTNNQTDVYYESPLKHTGYKFDFESTQQSKLAQNQDDVQTYLCTYAKSPMPRQVRSRVRNGSASTKRTQNLSVGEQQNKSVSNIDQICGSKNLTPMRQHNRPPMRRINTQT